jgi:hypothetical protein
MLSKLNYPYKCKFCGTPYVVLQGYYDWSFLPVEIKTGEEINDKEFDKTKHVSHLLNCKELQDHWEAAKKKIQKDLEKAEKVL